MVSKLRRVREEHRTQVLGRLRADGPLTRAVLARDLSLSAQSISEIMAELEAEGYVAAAGEATSSGGRRPLLYELRQDSFRAVGVHIGSEHLTAVVSDLSGRVYAQATVECNWSEDRTIFVTALQEVLDQLLTDQDLTQLAGIGVGVPSTMHRREAGVVRPAGKSGWDNAVDLTTVLRRFNLPVVAENRAHAVAVGEHLFGSARDVGDVLCLMLDRGLGGAVITGGRLFTGGDGGAGALGRMVLNLPGAEPVRVSDRLGAEAIVASARSKLRAAGRARLGGVPVAKIDLDHVIDQAVAGDQLMVEVIVDVGCCLGAVVAATLCVTDSQLVLLCGSMMRAGVLIVDPLVDELKQRWQFALPEIRLGQLGARAVALGAAALVLTDKIGTVDRSPAI